MCKKLFCMISLLVLLSITRGASAGLILHWTFDEGSGSTVIDHSGNGHDGTIEGNPQWVVGKLGGALDFGGNGDRVVDDNGGDYLNGLTAMTVAVWIKSNLTGTDKGFIEGEDPDGGDNVCTIRYDASGASYGGSNVMKMAVTCDSEQQLESSANIQTTEWQHVAMTWASGDIVRLYVNGVEDTPTGNAGPSSGPQSGVMKFIVGQGAKDAGGGWDGLIDDVRIYDTALTEIELQGVMAGGGTEYPLAAAPSPENGSMVEATWASLSWHAGDFAASHDVYLSDNFEDVNNGAEAAFQGNLTDTSLIVGFFGFPIPDGLMPGTTYYWRVDEVNDSEPNSPWIGDVWSFSVPSNTAYDPIPADGAKFIAPDASLSWTPGFNAKIHTVYFGDNFDDVNNASGGSPQGPATFTPAGPLEPDKTYYWRVDEFDPPTTYKGDVWSFQVAKEGGGIKADYYKGMNFENLVLTRTDPRIDFNWGNPGGPDPQVGDDQFSARWTGEVEAAFTETYTFYTNSDDGVRLWIDGQRLVNNWTNHGNTENSGKIDLVAGQTYSVVMEYYEDGGGAVAQLRWSSPRTPKDFVPAAALSELTMANTPMPRNGSVGAKLVSALTWKQGDTATSHEVYFGTDADAVANATKASTEYKGSRQPGSESLDPGALAFNTDYYWRVDEVTPNGTVIGNVWSFNTGDFLLVDDFESYNNIDPPDTANNRIFDTWIDGFGTTTNGALAGNDLPPYAELNDVHGGEQALPYRYDNTGKTSEATMTLVWPRDWTQDGVTQLSLWFKGDAANSADRIFVALNGTAVVYHDDSAATQIARWTQWSIDLSQFGVNLSNVNSITIGIGTKNVPAIGGGTGTVLFDDIRLY